MDFVKEQEKVDEISFHKKNTRRFTLFYGQKWDKVLHSINLLKTQLELNSDSGNEMSIRELVKIINRGGSIYDTFMFDTLFNFNIIETKNQYYPEEQDTFIEMNHMKKQKHPMISNRSKQMTKQITKSHMKRCKYKNNKHMKRRAR